MAATLAELLPAVTRVFGRSAQRDRSGLTIGGHWRYVPSMASAALNLPAPLDAFVEEQVRSGAYRDRDALIRDAVSLLRDRSAEDDAKLARLNARLQAATESLDRGEGTVVVDIDAFFDDISREIDAEMGDQTT